MRDSAGLAGQCVLRHLDVLLHNPTLRDVKAIQKYWDDGRTDAVDPFPAIDNPQDASPKSDAPAYDYCIGCHCDTCAAVGCNDCLTHQGSCWNRPQESAELVDLRAKLARLERLPENEASQFQLESEIYKLEREADAETEWPDEIANA